MNKPIISLVTLALAIGFGFFYVVPAYNRSQSRLGDIESLKKILSTSAEIKTLIGKTKDNLSSIESSGMARFDVFLPEKIDQIRFANNIQSIGIKNRVVLSGIKVEALGGATEKSAGGASIAKNVANTFSIGAQVDKAQGVLNGEATGSTPDAASKGSYTITTATFTFTTTFEAFQLLLNDFEKSLGVIDITSLTFVPAPVPVDAKTTSAPLYQFAMTIQTYSLK